MVDIEEKIYSAKRLQKTLRRLIDEKLNPLLLIIIRMIKVKFLLLNPS